ncbi:MAG: nucleotide pyrophosphohydrolase [Candidatus Aenigmarchaeota archaeon]|nr:nucleotide pyrophosphohydrolase [Candidatus Aenigmarchaeota archaeon]NIP40298.1 nucleotide pyrophosphohydrolase [Candidatus Aenigmarchaeota archaeon]NIQ17790.1 nucleotide pyrophosphohydrolase [Candidatus Aenigmarchaeota archaeon]NIS73173.1 nucleotide pyrophosphohydrolase [Candidatus Aenigmarchaeota archaeon]
MPSESDEYVNIEKLKERVRHFVRERDWEKYHNPKDLAIAISVEAGELLELFQWMKENEVEKIKENDTFMKNIERELADILNFCLNLANVLDLDLTEIILSKLKEAEKKYPKEKYKGVWSKPEG